MSRFTVSRHEGGPEGDHFDLMLEAGDVLRTWRIQHLNFENPQAAKRIQDHRKKYLDYEGEVSGRRGRVRIHDTGAYAADVWTDDLVQVSLAGAQLKARVRLARKEGETWTIVDAAADLRKLASSHLRNVELDAAPTPELGALRDELAREERKLLAFVGRYSKGEAVDWAAAEIDPAVADRLRGEWIRWRHPWLDQARAFADRLTGLATAVREAKPAGTDPTSAPQGR
ncbi:MAG: hypothetical protein HYY17_04055 [Planctomycetes bacterium]|nr:hypothetical protein [Planctomycetota bacterium]